MAGSKQTTKMEPTPVANSQEVTARIVQRQEELLKTHKLCYQCNGTRNDLRPGSSGCSACQSTGLVPKEWLRCVKCQGTGSDPNELAAECKACNSTGHLKDCSRQPCFKCHGTGNDESSTKMACDGCDSSGYILADLQQCFKCKGSGQCTTSVVDGCDACGNLGHLPSHLHPCPQCKGSGLDPDTDQIGCARCKDLGYLGEWKGASLFQKSILSTQEEVEPDQYITALLLFTVAALPVALAILCAYYTTHYM